MANAQIRNKGSYRDNVKQFFQAERDNTERILKAELGLREDEDLPAYKHQEYPKHMQLTADPGDYVVVNSAEEEQQAVANGAFTSMAAAKEAEATAAEEEAAANATSADYLQQVNAAAQAVRTNKKAAAKAATPSPAA